MNEKNLQRLKDIKCFLFDMDGTTWGCSLSPEWKAFSAN